MNFNGLPPVGGPPNPAAFFNPPAPVNPGAEFRPNRRPFSSFSGDGTTTFQQDLPNGLPNNMFSTDDYTMTGYDDGNDQGDPKRRRIARVWSHSSPAHAATHGKSGFVLMCWI